MDALRQIFQNLLDRFMQMPVARRMTVLVVFVGMMAGGVFFSMMEKSGGDGVLFSNLSPGIRWPSRGA